MKALPGLALVLALIAAVIAVIALVSGDDGEDEGEQVTLTYTEKGGEFAPIGEFPQGDQPQAPGNGFALSIPLVDDADEEVGSINAICLTTTKDGYTECVGTATVPDGTLTLSVSAPDLDDDVNGAVVGGTEAYAGAYGTFTSVGGEGDRSTDTFEFTVPEADD
jgi:hypothetical protein